MRRPGARSLPARSGKGIHREQIALSFFFLQRVGSRQGFFLLVDVRPLARQIGVQRRVGRPLVRKIILGEDGLGRANGLASTAVDAFVRMDDEKVRDLIEAVHRAHGDAIGVFAGDARLRNDERHGRSSEVFAGV